MTCQRPGCPGTIVDGYCDVCGLPPADVGPSVPASAPAPAPAPLPMAAGPAAGGTGPAAAGTGPAAAGTGVAPAGPVGPPSAPPPDSADGVAGWVPAMRAGGPCQMPGCPGRIVDGYCTTCGAPAGATRPEPPVDIAHLTTASRLSTAALGSSLAGGARARPTPPASGRISQLGAGYTSVTPEPPVDPASAILANPEVPEDRRFCPHCGTAVGRSTPDQPGRLEGYCPQCRQPFSFTPKLGPGDVVAGQYDVRGCLAHGGMGWIYLAQDHNVSDRWVVLKGLLNAGDEAASQAAVTEQRFLAQLQNPLIVEIYNVVSHAGGAYIVMEYVGGRSLKQILKDRMAANAGVYDPLPPDQALAYVLEILPGFSYLHQRGLLYCDFKPDNLIHVADTVKLIDMGGVRRMDDDESVIFGTVGFQAPEVAGLGPSIASDIYTIGRTLLVLVAEVKGYQTTYATSLPALTELPAFVRYDSLYRLVLKCCAANPADRFASVEELRAQTLGVLRQVVANPGTAATDAVASSSFDPPTVVGDVFTWHQLPSLKADPADPATAWLNSIDPSLNARDRLAILTRAPIQTLAVRLATGLTAIASGATTVLDQVVRQILADDPWQWRAAWLQGLAALNSSQWQVAEASFNAVYGQLPGELAPQFSLAVACEMAGDTDVAEGLYQLCAATDAAYVTGAAFGLARVRSKRPAPPGPAGGTPAVLAALDLVPATSGGYAQSRRLAATYLAQASWDLADLQRAYAAVQAAGPVSADQLRLELQIFQKALPMAPYATIKAARHRRVDQVGDTALTRATIRRKIESILRTWAGIELDPSTRVALIDQANSMRGWTIA